MQHRLRTLFPATKAWFLPLLVFFVFNQPLVAQFHTLTITSPESEAGSFEAVIAAFGPGFCEVESLSGELVLALMANGSTLACGAIATDLTGKIAVVDRGTCGFSAKVLNAQNRGAIAVIVANNQANQSQANFSMAAGPEAPQITIPAFMIRYGDGQAFRDALVAGTTVSATISRNVAEFPEENIVWGDAPEEGQFGGGLNGWTARNIACGNGPAGSFELWRWDAGGRVPNGSCGGGGIFSPSSCNGAMFFQSDFYDNGDNPGPCQGGAQGLGPCPANQIGELISPPIDLTGSDAAAFSLRFYQETRQFLSTYYVGWSTDDGVTWDSTEVNTDLSPNTSNTPEQAIVKIALPGVTNAVSNLRVKFRYEADYYFWIIDDVQIIEQSANDLRVNGNFFAIPQNVIMPLSQVEPIRFLADIENVGAATQTNVYLDMIVLDGDGNPVYIDSLSYGDVPDNTLVENVPFDNTFTPTDTGLYVGNYLIRADQEDADLLNNIQSFPFLVNDTIFSKEVGATTIITPAATNWDPGAAHQAGYGNYFYVPNGGDYIRTVTFGIGNANVIAGSTLTIALYKWLADTDQDELVDPDEREFVDFNFYLVEGTEAPLDEITLPFPEPGSPPVQLEENTAYLLMVQYVPPDGNPTQDLQMVFSDDFDYSAMTFVNQLAGTPRYSTLTALDGDLSTASFNTFGFGRNTVPVVRMSVGANPLTSRKEVQVLRDQFVAFPNPTSGLVNLQLNLQETARTARVRIFDISGRLMLQQEYDNVQRDRLSFDLSNWHSGTYIVELSTDKGTGTRRIVLSNE